MTEMELTLPDEQFQALLSGERGLAVVLQAVLKPVLEAEMTEHLGATPHERTSSRRGHADRRSFHLGGASSQGTVGARGRQESLDSAWGTSIFSSENLEKNDRTSQILLS